MSALKNTYLVFEVSVSVPYLPPPPHPLFLLQSAGIANRAIRPMLGIVDPLHTLHMSPRLTANSGYDVLW